VFPNPGDRYDGDDAREERDADHRHQLEEVTENACREDLHASVIAVSSGCRAAADAFPTPAPRTLTVR
jgi:hypothetical protein